MTRIKCEIGLEILDGIFEIKRGKWSGHHSSTLANRLGHPHY
jgi:hypothetical protein